MVNYLYALDDLEANLEAFTSEGRIATSAAIRRQAQPPK
jgi:malonyl-CoA decarboxylase